MSASQQPDTPAGEQSSIDELQRASENLKSKIEDAKKANEMPVDAALGSPQWEQQAADGRFDRKDDEDEE